MGATDAWASFMNSSELLLSALVESALNASESAFLASSRSFSFSSKPFLSASMVAASDSFSRVISRIVRCCCARWRLRASTSFCRSGMLAATASNEARRFDSSRSCSIAASRWRLACAACWRDSSNCFSACSARWRMSATSGPIARDRKNHPAIVPMASPRRRMTAVSTVLGEYTVSGRLAQRQRGRGAQHLA